MEKSGDREEFLELYKLHADLADRVSQRREAANRLYVGLLTGIVLLIAAIIRFGADKIPGWSIAVCAIIGMMLSFSWLIIIHTYKELNSAKFSALNELENKLAYPFFRKEQEFATFSRSGKITDAETVLPWIFGIVFSCVLSIRIVKFFQ